MNDNVLSVLSSLRDGLTFAQEEAKLEFSVQLHDVMGRCGINQKSLSQRTGKTEAYISKALRGDANLTLDTMVDLVRGAGGRFDFRICKADSGSRWFEVVNGAKRAAWGNPTWQERHDGELRGYDPHNRNVERGQDGIAA